MLGLLTVAGSHLRLSCCVPRQLHMRCLTQVSTDRAPPDTFTHDSLVVKRATHLKPLPKLETLEFGKYFTDHMFAAEHSDEHGWSDPSIVPFGPVMLHPAAPVLHYGMGCFEGMKAYMGPDGKGRLFRPEMNMARLHRSAQRLMLADFDTQELLQCLKSLLQLDRRWIPKREGYAVYIRPFMFASAETLGIHQPSATTVSIVLSPVGPYFPRGNAVPVSLYLDEANVRAWPGGAGDSKIGSNYAPTVLPQTEAHRKHGCSQVVYAMPRSADPMEATVSECGAMNMFFLLRHAGGRRELVTPPLDGTILPGVTRDSVLQLCRQLGEMEVSERQLTVGELLSAHAEGRVEEVFGTGTASVIQPVNRLVRSGGTLMDIPFDSTSTATLAYRLTRTLMDIQYGRVPHEWSVAFE